MEIFRLTRINSLKSLSFLDSICIFSRQYPQYRAIVLSDVIFHPHAYSLVVRFKEDHNNCKVAPEVTLFLLDEEKWKSSKDYLPLQLAGSVNWSDINSRTHETELTFKAVKTGDWELEVIRECSKKEGYDEYLLFCVN